MRDVIAVIIPNKSSALCTENKVVNVKATYAYNIAINESRMVK